MGRISQWLQSTNVLVYTSTTLSNWGDRMWSFAMALFLIKLSPESLRLTAAYGLSCGGAVLLFGPIIGDWVDRVPRLRAARITLISQNTFVAISAVLILILLSWSDDIASVHDGVLIPVFHVVVIFVAVLARLAGTGNRISVHKDWVTEICERDKDKLAVMTASIRRLDLLAKILAPIVTGQIMAFTSNLFACCFISAWNVVSVFFEYYLLWKVYTRVPRLANKVYKQSDKKPNATKRQNETPTEGAKGDNSSPAAQYDRNDIRPKEDEEKPYKECETPVESPDKKDKPKTSTNETKSCCRPRRIFVGFSRLINGWKTYMKYRVAFAGMALAFLYMTVLGFDNITMGYAYSQGVSEWVLGVIMGLGAVMGISGTFAYPQIRRRVGLERTGLISMTFQMSSLMLCVASVWAAGSPFDPLFYINGGRKDNCTRIVGESPSTNINSNSTIGDTYSYLNCPYHSIILLLTGISLARFGLWVSDLTITQLQLETVDETERGVVNGVQLSLNMLLDMIKFGLVVVLPNPEVFGYLVLLSFIFGLASACLYGCYTYRVRGHILPHCDKGPLVIENSDGGDIPVQSIEFGGGTHNEPISNEQSAELIGVKFIDDDDVDEKVTDVKEDNTEKINDNSKDKGENRKNESDKNGQDNSDKLNDNSQDKGENESEESRQDNSDELNDNSKNQSKNNSEVSTGDISNSSKDNALSVDI